MDDVLTHELIHAYDFCRAHVDWNNLDHLACTEVHVYTCCYTIEKRERDSSIDYIQVRLELSLQHRTEFSHKIIMQN